MARPKLTDEQRVISEAKWKHDRMMNCRRIQGYQGKRKAKRIINTVNIIKPRIPIKKQRKERAAISTKPKPTMFTVNRIGVTEWLNRALSIEEFKERAELVLKRLEIPEKPIFKIGTKVKTKYLGDKFCVVRKIIGTEVEGIVLTEEAIPLIQFECGTYYVYQGKLERRLKKAS